MADYRRWHVAGGTYFFTVVTHSRYPLFADPFARQTLGDKLRDCQRVWPFTIDAIVLLPEHLHTIWTLPSGDAKYPMRWGWIKKEFTKAWLAAGGIEQTVSEERRKRGDRGVWQFRYWEHTIEDEDDFDRHFDYTHYNPTKHGHVTRPSDWPHWSIHRWMKAGVYEPDWGSDAVAGDEPTGEPPADVPECNQRSSANHRPAQPALCRSWHNESRCNRPARGTR